MVVIGVGGQFVSVIANFYGSTGGFVFMASPFAFSSLLLFWFVVFSSSLFDLLSGQRGSLFGTIFDD